MHLYSIIETVLYMFYEAILNKSAYSHWVFYFQGSRFPLSCSGTLSGSMHKIHIACKNSRLLC